MKVLVPSPLRPYTDQRMVEAAGKTLAELLADLDEKYPGIRFRMIDEQDAMVFDLGRELRPDDEIQIVQALSGG
jgi:molybdopterin synthase sulfur carrier subunit